jgi:REP element-mobilizing transposase RayT
MNHRIIGAFSVDARYPGQARGYMGETVTLAIHLIWTTYGTWLPGDDRGHWSPLFDMYGHLLQRGHKLNLPDACTRARVVANMTEPAKVLNAEEIQIMADVIERIVNGVPVGRYTPGKPGAICRALALAIESNHVHLLVGPLSEDLHATVGRFKGVSSSLIGALPVNAARRHTWTAGFWRVFLFDEEAIRTVFNYVIGHNLREGRPAHPWDFTRADGVK